MSTKFNILLTGGRAPSTLHLARLLNKEEHKIFIAESIEDHICKFSNIVLKNYNVSSPRNNKEKYIQELLSIIKNEEIDLLIPTCEEIFYIAENIETIKQYCNILCDKSEKLLALHNKWEFINSVKNTEIKAPKSWKASSSKELKATLTKLKGSKKIFILKAVYSRFSSKVFTGTSSELNNLELDISFANPWILQEFIEGKQLCTFSVAHKGIIKAHTTYSANFTAGLGSSINFKPEEHPQILNWITKKVKYLDYTGQIGFDLIQTNNNKIFVIECNPRITSGINLFNDSKVVEAFLNKNNEVIKPDQKSKTMLSLAMLTYGISSIKTFKNLKTWIQTLLSSNDIIFSNKDPIPFFHQFYILVSLGITAIKNNIKIIEASTQDIEWNGKS